MFGIFIRWVYGCVWVSGIICLTEVGFLGFGWGGVAFAFWLFRLKFDILCFLVGFVFCYLVLWVETLKCGLV